MPTYLRWTVSLTSAVTAYFAYSILTLGIVRASGHTTVSGALGGLLGLGANLIAVLTALAVIDWIRSRYPTEQRPRPSAPPPDSVSSRDSMSE